MTIPKQGKTAWESLKDEFNNNCPDPENWIVDEDFQMLIHKKSTCAIQAQSYPFWRNIYHAKGIQ